MNFTLADKEQENFHNWNKNHLEKYHEGKEPNSGAIGGRITFHFTLTSIGQICSVSRCPNERSDLIDYLDW